MSSNNSNRTCKVAATCGQSRPESRLRRRVPVWAALLSVGLLLTQGCSLIDPDFQRQYAIVYGVARYDGIVGDLRGTDNDAVAMRNLLKSRGYEVVFRLSADTYGRPEQSTPTLPTRTQLEQDLATAAAVLDEGDSFVLFFAGHGGRLSDFSGTAIEDTSEPRGHRNEAEYLVFYDDIDTYLPPTSHLEAISMKDDDLAGHIRRIPARNKTIIIDACNSGGLIGDSPSYDPYPQQYAHESRDPAYMERRSAVDLYFSLPGATGADITYRDAVVLAAAGADEVALERRIDGDDFAGVFTTFFVQGASEGDIDGDGFIAASEMFAYISRAMKEHHNFDYYHRDWNYLPRLSGGAIDTILFPVQ